MHPGITSRSVTHPQISSGQARLTSELFGDQLPEKKLQLIGMSILLILLSPGPGCHRHSEARADELKAAEQTKTASMLNLVLLGELNKQSQ